MADKTLNEEGLQILQDIDDFIESCKQTIRTCRNPKEKQELKCNLNLDVLQKYIGQKRFSFKACVEECLDKKSLDSYKQARKRLKKGCGSAGDYEKMKDLYERMLEKFQNMDSLFRVSPLPEKSNVLHENLKNLMRWASQKLERNIFANKEKV